MYILRFRALGERFMSKSCVCLDHHRTPIRLSKSTMRDRDLEYLGYIPGIVDELLSNTADHNEKQKTKAKYKLEKAL